MKEKVLIKSERYNVKYFLIIMVLAGVIASGVIFFSSYYMYINDYDTYLEHQEKGSCGSWYGRWEDCWICEEFEEMEEYGTIPTKFNYAITQIFEYDFYFIIPFVVCMLIGSLIYFWLRSYELIITDKRICGKVAWGKRVDLPVDYVSSISTTLILKGISVSTASGRISFRLIKNMDEIYNVIVNLLIERQQVKVNNHIIKNSKSDKIGKIKDI